MRVLMVSAFLPALHTHAGAARCFMVAQGISRTHELDVLSFIDSDAERVHLPALERFCRNVTVRVRQRTPHVGDLIETKPRHIVTEYSDPAMAQDIAARVASGS